MRQAASLVLAGLLLGAADAPPPPPGTMPPTEMPSPAASLPAVSPQKLAVAHELLDAMDTQANAMQMLHNLRDVLVQNIQARNPSPAIDVPKVVDDVLMPELSAHLGEFEDSLAQVQATVYSTDELHQLIAFYHTPLGRRMIEVAPKVGALSFMAGQDWGRRVATDALRKHADELRQRGVNL